MENNFSTLSRSLWKIFEGFVALGRLYALRSLGLPQISDKLIATAQCQRSIDSAHRLANFMHRAYARREPLIYWHNQYSPQMNGIFNDNKIHIPTVDHFINELSPSLSMAIHNLHEKVAHSTALHPIATLLCELAPWLCLEKTTSLELNDLCNEKNTSQPGMMKAFSGPMHVPIDNVFTPLHSLIDQAAPEYGKTIREATPYYWGLAARECLAGDMCALSLIEYDGLPIEFYVDMAKQSHDEIRHAAIFLDITKHLLPQLKVMLTEDEDLYKIIVKFEQTGSGLPIPLERHLYETIWHAGLIERFILMHHDTETPGINRLRDKMESEFSQHYPYIANKLEIVMREEVTHARIGDKWLKYLVPNPMNRANAVKHARLMRGILLLANSAHYRNEPLSDIIHQIIDNETRKCANE